MQIRQKIFNCSDIKHFILDKILKHAFLSSVVAELSDLKNSPFLAKPVGSLITGKSKFDHITDTLVDLHWLPVRQHIQFKLCSLVSECQRRTAPSYLADICISVSAMSGRTHLRSAIHCDLVVPRTCLARCGPRSFAVSVR